MAMVWGGLQNFTAHDFAKGPRILNTMMAFVLTLWFHYNTITKPRTHFVLSLGGSLYGFSFTYDSIYDRNLSRHTHDKLIFPSTHASSHTCTFLFLLPLSSLAWELSVRSDA